MSAEHDVIEWLRRELKEAKGSAVLCEELYLGTVGIVKRCREITKCPDDETIAVWLEKEFKARVRLDDPVVKGLAIQLERAQEALAETVSMLHPGGVIYPGGNAIVCLAQHALAAYNARLKEITQ